MRLFLLSLTCSTAFFASAALASYPEDSLLHVMEELKSYIIKNCIVFEWSALEIIDPDDLVKLNSISGLGKLAYVVKQIALIPDGRIPSMEYWTENFLKHFLDAYEADCPSMGAVSKVRVGFLRETYNAENAKAFADGYVRWSVHECRYLAPFRLFKGLPSCTRYELLLHTAFRQTFEWTFQFFGPNWGVSNSYVDRLLEKELVDYQILEKVRPMATFRENRGDPWMRLSPLNMLRYWRSRSDRVTAGQVIASVTEDERNWAKLVGTYITNSPQSEALLFENYQNLSSHAKEALLNYKTPKSVMAFLITAPVDTNALVPAKENLHQYIKDAMKSAIKGAHIRELFDILNYPQEALLADAFKLAVSWSHIGETYITTNIDYVIERMFFSYSFGYGSNLSTNEARRLLKIRLLIDRICSLAPADEQIDLEDLDRSLKDSSASNSKLNTLYALITSDSRYTSILHQPALFWNSVSFRNEVSLPSAPEFPESIVSFLLRLAHFPKDRSDLVAALLDPSFEHQAASVGPKVHLKSSREDIITYIELGRSQ